MDTKRVFKISFSKLNYLLIIIASLIGLVEGGILGLITGLISSLLCWLCTFLGIIPFVGIPLYWITAHFLNDFLTDLGIAVPISQAISFWGFLIPTAIVNILLSFIVLLIILVAIFRRK